MSHWTPGCVTEELRNLIEQEIHPHWGHAASLLVFYPLGNHYLHHYVWAPEESEGDSRLPWIGIEWERLDHVVFGGNEIP